MVESWSVSSVQSVPTYGVALLKGRLRKIGVAVITVMYRSRNMFALAEIYHYDTHCNFISTEQININACSIVILTLHFCENNYTDI